jgi:hypothetical protein
VAITEEQKEKLRTMTVEVILSNRRQYLALGANALTHWDMLHNRALSAVRRSGTVDKWVSLFRRSLQLAAPDSSACSVILDLTTTVKELRADGATLAMIRDELGLLMAMARKCAEERKEAKANGNDSI